ncbi:MAG TPA: hypothetical protein VKP10_11145 [Gemmatimonadales bacterium]|nr:hypothetical protein [Gemmatimonadales bacterium]
MLRSSLLVSSLVAAVVWTGGCSLDIGNPNAPDKNRAFADPAGLAKLMSGAFRTWVGTRGDYFGALPMTAMADNYTASWNNAAIRFYSSVGSDCPSRCGWTNSATAPEAAGGPSVESQWYGYYTVLVSANAVLTGIKNGVCFDDDCTTDSTLTVRDKAIAKMLQGMAFAGISLVYDQGFVVDENTDLTNISAIPFNTRAEVRDAALQKFEEAWTLAGVGSWITDGEWAGVGSGRIYTNTQIRQLIRTMQAELVALWPRNGTENLAADWASVVTYASQGVSSGAPFNWEYYVDITGRECGDLDCVKTWGNSIGTMRVDTRVAKMITTNHVSPWPEPAGNPCPTVSPDKRVGDGSWGPSDDFSGYATKAATASAGTDFACSGVAIFPAARGNYHQSNLQHIRYNYLGYQSSGETLPGVDATGQDPFYTTQMNDLLWAEGLIRSGGDKALAAVKINNSRVGRGGLPGLTGAEADTVLLDALHYEQEIEFMGQGPTPFFNRRRIDGFTFSSKSGLNDQTGTPRQMPVPAKEMDVLQRSVYTFGGPSAPDMVTTNGGTRRETVKEIWDEYIALRRSMSGRHN